MHLYGDGYRYLGDMSGGYGDGLDNRVELLVCADEDSRHVAELPQHIVVMIGERADTVAVLPLVVCEHRPCN